MSNFDLSPKGQWVELELFGKTILAFILDEKSPLKKDGWKMFFGLVQPIVWTNSKRLLSRVKNFYCRVFPIEAFSEGENE